jgi:hypothetical protein
MILDHIIGIRCEEIGDDGGPEPVVTVLTARMLKDPQEHIVE